MGDVKQPTLVDQLTKAGLSHKRSALGGLLQWAALHIADQDDALKEIRHQHAYEQLVKEKLERTAYETKAAIEAALALVSAPLYIPGEIMRDYSSHINLMAAYGDPDYLMSSGKSVRHVDCRIKKRTSNS